MWKAAFNVLENPLIFSWYPFSFQWWNYILLTFCTILSLLSLTRKCIGHTVGCHCFAIPSITWNNNMWFADATISKKNPENLTNLRFNFTETISFRTARCRSQVVNKERWTVADLNINLFVARACFGYSSVYTSFHVCRFVTNRWLISYKINTRSLFYLFIFFFLLLF